MGSAPEGSEQLAPGLGLFLGRDHAFSRHRNRVDSPPSLCACGPTAIEGGAAERREDQDRIRLKYGLSYVRTHRTAKALAGSITGWPSATDAD